MSGTRVHQMGVGDLLPILAIKAKVEILGEEQPMDLTGASVVFTMTDSDDVAVVDEQVAVLGVDPEDGDAQYVWQAGDTDARGVYDAKFIATGTVYGSGPITIPNGQHIRVIIT